MLSLKKKVVEQVADSRQDDPSVFAPTSEDTGPKCEDCGRQGKFALNRKEGTIVCTNCGLVAKSQIIDETSEWRNFGDEGPSSQNRVGGKLNPYLSDFGLSTCVQQGPKELKLWSDRTALSSSDKTIQKGHQRIKELAHCLNLKSQTLNKAFDMYKIISDSQGLKGRSIDARVATIIFMASRYEDQPKPIKTILAFTECSSKELSKCYKAIKEQFPLY